MVSALAWAITPKGKEEKKAEEDAAKTEEDRKKQLAEAKKECESKGKSYFWFANECRSM